MISNKSSFNSTSTLFLVLALSGSYTGNSTGACCSRVCNGSLLLLDKLCGLCIQLSIKGGLCVVNNLTRDCCSRVCNSLATPQRIRKYKVSEFHFLLCYTPHEFHFVQLNQACFFAVLAATHANGISGKLSF